MVQDPDVEMMCLLFTSHETVNTGCMAHCKFAFLGDIVDCARIMGVIAGVPFFLEGRVRIWSREH
jgi:hypothetical protein